jgi:hypothetical protein
LGGTLTEFANDTNLLEAAFELQPTQKLNIILVRTEQEHEPQLFEGVPDDFGIDEASVYVVFIYARCLITVWVNGELQPEQRQPISQLILNYVKYRTRLM